MVKILEQSPLNGGAIEVEHKFWPISRQKVHIKLYKIAAFKHPL